MSFMEERSAVDVCNKALSRISQAPIVGALDDPANGNRHAARECRLWYPKVVRSLLEKHHWGIATVRAPLAEVGNDDSLNWTYAYQTPTDMAFPVSIDLGTTYGTTAISYYQGVGYLLAELYGRPMFKRRGKTLYAHTVGAMLEYVSYNITEADFTDTFEDLVVLALAAPLARSVAKDEDLARGFEEQLTTAINQAIAHELNMGRPRYGEGVTDAERARFGVGYTFAGGYLGL